MPDSSAAFNPTGDSPASARAGDLRRLNLRAVFRGAVVGAGGALLFSTLIGVAAVLNMAGDGLSPKTIALQLRSQWDLKIALALAEVFMAMLAGYTAAMTAGHARFRHAIFAGMATLAANLSIVAVCGSPLPILLATGSMSLTVPMAMLGAYLGSPRPSASTTQPNSSALTSSKR